MSELNQNNDNDFQNEFQENFQNDFIVEKIKERPVNKKKLVRRTIITASMAVIFGLIACLTFLVLEPVFSNLLYPEDEPQVVTFPEDSEEMSPEEMLADNMQNESNQNVEESSGGIILEEEQIEEIFSEHILNLDNYKQLYNSINEYIYEVSRSMVTITGVTSSVDWLDTVQESEQQVSGVIIANNGKELLVLAEYEPVSEAESLSLTFFNELKVNASVKERDSVTGLAVFAVNLEELAPGMLENELVIANLGSSNVSNIIGTPVVAVGSPMGSKGSIGVGMITAVNQQTPQADTNYKYLQTDIVGSKKANGVLFNMYGQVVGIITTNNENSDMGDMLEAYGITELKKRIEKMSNGEKAAYMGISGVDVTREAHESLSVPYGAYVKEVDMDSPAMMAGIQQGDVIIGMGGRSILTYSEYTTLLMQLDVGNTVDCIVMRQSQDEYKSMKIRITLGEAQ